VGKAKRAHQPIQTDDGSVGTAQVRLCPPTASRNRALPDVAKRSLPEIQSIAANCNQDHQDQTTPLPFEHADFSASLQADAAGATIPRWSPSAIRLDEYSTWPAITGSTAASGRNGLQCSALPPEARKCLFDCF